MSSKYNKQPQTQQPQHPDVTKMNRGGQDRTLMVGQQVTAVSGPIPSAEEFKGYEDAVSGSGNRILAMAEVEASERHVNTRKLVGGQTFQSYAGPVFGFVLTFVALFFGYDLTIKGHDVGGMTSLVLAAGSLAGSFLALVKRSRPK